MKNDPLERYTFAFPLQTTQAAAADTLTHSLHPEKCRIENIPLNLKYCNNNTLIYVDFV